MGGMRRALQTLHSTHSGHGGKLLMGAPTLGSCAAMASPWDRHFQPPKNVKQPSGPLSRREHYLGVLLKFEIGGKVGGPAWRKRMEPRPPGEVASHIRPILSPAAPVRRAHRLLRGICISFLIRRQQKSRRKWILTGILCLRRISHSFRISRLERLKFAFSSRSADTRLLGRWWSL